MKSRRAGSAENRGHGKRPPLLQRGSASITSYRCHREAVTSGATSGLHTFPATRADTTTERSGSAGARTPRSRGRHIGGVDMPERTCAVCDEDISHKRSHARYCSRRCYDKDHPRARQAALSVALGQRRCGWCDKTFTARPDRRKYCSQSCANRYSQTRGTSCDIPWRQCRDCDAWFVRHSAAASCKRCRNKPPIRRVCWECQRDITDHHASAKFCSDA